MTDTFASLRKRRCGPQNGTPFGLLDEVFLLGLALILTLIGNGPTTARAAPPDDVRDDVAAVRPLIRDRTVLIAKLDPAKLDLPQFDGLNWQQVPDGASIAQRLEDARETALRMTDGLRSGTGGQPIYASLGIPMSKTDVPLLFVVKAAAEVDRPWLLDHLRLAGPEISATVRQGRLLIAPVKAERIDTVLGGVEPQDRDELAAAFESVSSYPIQLLLLPPDYLRRTIRELVPQLPEQWGGGSTDALTEGIQWAAVGIDPAGLHVEIIFQSASEAAAKRLLEALPRFFAPGTTLHDQMRAALKTDRISERDAFDGWLSKLGALIETTQEGDRVVVRLQQKETIAASASLLALVESFHELQGRIHRNKNMDKFKQILLAMHNYHDTYGSFPPAAKFRNDNGNPRLSWRVHLLPFLDQAELYQRFRRDEPWDSPHNRALIDKLPDVYASGTVVPKGQTTFLAPSGKDTVLGSDEAVRFQDITDGTSNTAVLVEVKPERAVPWTAPQDYRFDPQAPSEGLLLRDGRFLNGMSDGSVQQLQSDVPAETLRRLFHKSDGNILDWNAK